MLVKKFEAPSMKEALEMVKNHLGPEAIILSARDNSKSFGLAGKNSVEVTAAISEVQVKKRQVAESRISLETKEQLRKSSARIQKQFIEKSIDRFQAQVKPQESAKSSAAAINRSHMRYIDIADEESENLSASVRSQGFSESQISTANMRVKDAARAALSAAQDTFKELTHVAQKPNVQDQKEIVALKDEVKQLKSLLENFKRSPQTVVSLHPGAHDGLPYEMSFLFNRLAESGVSHDNAVTICKKGLQELSAEQLKKRPLVDAWAVKNMLSEITLVNEPFNSGVHLFVGGSGHGKTSMLVKMASHFVIKEHKNIAILTTDTRRVGSKEQLKIYAQILNVPFAVIQNKSDWENVLLQLRGCHAVLVDVPGLSLKNLEEIDLIQSLMPPPEVKKTVHLVSSVNQKDADAFELGRRYRLLNISDVMFTKLDESVNHGLIYNFQREFKLPLNTFGVGPMIPEDFELSTKERVIDLIFKISKLKNS